MKLKTKINNIVKTLERPLGLCVLSFIFGNMGGIFHTYYYPKIFDKQPYSLKVITCSPSKMSGSFVNNKTGETFPTLNGIPAPITVSFENNGKNTLTDINLNIEFITDKNDFSLQAEGFTTLPLKGFGDIQIEKRTQTSRVLKVSIFNPGEKIIYHAFANYPATTLTYSKTIGLSFYRENRLECNF